jgi:hypothetical protein
MRYENPEGACGHLSGLLVCPRSGAYAPFA